MAGGGGGEPTPSAAPSPLGAKGLGPRRAAPGGGTDVDFTPMVDLVFMMNIYFLVTSLSAIAPDVDLPLARHVVAVDEAKSTAIVIVVSPDGKTPIVTAGEDGKGKLTDPDEQVESVKKAVEKGVRENKGDIVLRAERAVKLRDISRLAGAAGKVEGAKLYVGVLETAKK
ncbi:MAG TPA: biopolymer transporter ExbD [Planctomycetaceae bacterium]|nr:biopolymer transporter ExbD [Planctomycetaceae bacterium]